MVLRTFETEKERWNKFKTHCAKEGINLGEKINNFIDKELKEHGDGNPSYTIDQFVDNPGMKAVPAFFRSIEDWDKYLYEISEKEKQEILWQAQAIGARATKRLNS